MAHPPPDPLYILRGSGTAVNTLHFCCDGRGPPLLYSGSGKGAIHVWNLTTRRPERVLESHAGNSVIWLQALKESSTLISQGRDMRVCMWDLSEGRGAVSDSLLTGSVGFCQCCLLETQPGRTLLAHPTEHMEEVKVVEMKNWTQVCTLKPDLKLGMLMCMKMWQAESGPVLCAGYEDGSVILWDVSHRRPFISRLKVHSEPVMCLDVDVCTQKGISGSSENILHSWTLDDQQNLQKHNSVQLTNPGLSHLRIRADGKILATAGWDNNIRIFGWKKLKPLAVLQHHTDMVNSVAFSDHQDPTQRILAAGSKDQRITVWSIYSEV